MVKKAETKWGIKSNKEFENRITCLPDTILKEEFSKVSQITDDLMYGKCMSMKIEKNRNISSDDEFHLKNVRNSYEVATICDVVVPALGNYSSTILIVYSNLNNPYPLAITVCSDFISDIENFKADYLCSNEEEFQKALEEILSSEKVLNKLTLLYSKVAPI